MRLSLPAIFAEHDMSLPFNVIVFTHIPSPYQVELFNGLAKGGNLSLGVGYLYQSRAHRLWKTPDITHEHFWLEDDNRKYESARKMMADADLVVFNYYQHPQLLDLIKQRSDNGKPWCFWGERPGYHRYGQIGTLYRKWKFSALHHSQAPIWGMGKWAIAEYQREFGTQRRFFNVPYFSDLSRFKSNRQRDKGTDRCRFLFSGSLIRRKGVDLLAQAFNRLAGDFDHVTLTFLGAGSLRATLAKQLARYKDRIEFTGFREWDDLPSIYHAADILCVPSRYDGWNLVVPEGLAAGLLVIGTDRTGAALELVEPEKNGWLVSAGDGESLYAAMRKAAMLSQEELVKGSLAAEASVARHGLADGVERFLIAVEETLKA